MAKNLIILALAAIVILLGWLYLSPKTEPQEQVNQETVPTQQDSEICAQVITGARNPDTGEIREFATPCDVPDGWEVIQNDIPGFDLEVQ